MATVPVGNKSVGEVAVIATYSIKNISIKLNQLASYALVSNNVGGLLPNNTNNKMIMETSVIATTGSTPKANVRVNQLSSYAVIFYDPPTGLSAAQLDAKVVVLDTTSNLVASPLLNKFVGEVSVLATTAIKDSVNINQLCGYVVVKQTHPRKELTVFNIEYAAEN